MVKMSSRFLVGFAVVTLSAVGAQAQIGGLSQGLAAASAAVKDAGGDAVRSGNSAQPLGVGINSPVLSVANSLKVATPSSDNSSGLKGAGEGIAMNSAKLGSGTPSTVGGTSFGNALVAAGLAGNSVKSNQLGQSGGATDPARPGQNVAAIGLSPGGLNGALKGEGPAATQRIGN